MNTNFIWQVIFIVHIFSVGVVYGVITGIDVLVSPDKTQTVYIYQDVHIDHPITTQQVQWAENIKNTLKDTVTIISEGSSDKNYFRQGTVTNLEDNVQAIKFFNSELAKHEIISHQTDISAITPEVRNIALDNLTINSSESLQSKQDFLECLWESNIKQDIMSTDSRIVLDAFLKDIIKVINAALEHKHGLTNFSSESMVELIICYNKSYKDLLSPALAICKDLLDQLLSLYNNTSWVNTRQARCTKIKVGATYATLFKIYSLIVKAQERLLALHDRGNQDPAIYNTGLVFLYTIAQHAIAHNNFADNKTLQDYCLGINVSDLFNDLSHLVLTDPTYTHINLLDSEIVYYILREIKTPKIIVYAGAAHQKGIMDLLQAQGYTVAYSVHSEASKVPQLFTAFKETPMFQDYMTSRIILYAEAAVRKTQELQVPLTLTTVQKMLLIVSAEEINYLYNTFIAKYQAIDKDDFMLPVTEKYRF